MFSSVVDKKLSSTKVKKIKKKKTVHFPLEAQHNAENKVISKHQD